MAIKSSRCWAGFHVGKPEGCIGGGCTCPCHLPADPEPAGVPLAPVHEPERQAS